MNQLYRRSAVVLIAAKNMTIPNGMFSKKDLDVNSPLPKVDKISFIAKHPKASLIGITKSKLDSSILSSEVDIVGYDMLRMDR